MFGVGAYRAHHVGSTPTKHPPTRIPAKAIRAGRKPPMGSGPKNAAETTGQLRWPRSRRSGRSRQLHHRDAGWHHWSWQMHVSVEPGDAVGVRRSRALGVGFCLHLNLHFLHDIGWLSVAVRGT